MKTMRFYFAPLEGITRYHYRNIHAAFYPGITKYFSPFVVTRDGGIMKEKELRDILPQNNQNLCLVPQILTNDAANFLQASHQMQELGYEQVNLNLGCPSGTVTAKGRGAGFLRWDHRKQLESFLDEIFAKATVAISVKTRIGWEDAEEFPSILEVFNQYPIKELTIHPRTRKEFYTGSVHLDTFRYAYEHSNNPLCYNGDITTVSDYQALLRDFPDIEAVMIGRGLIANPGLVGQIMGQQQDKQHFIQFYQALFTEYESFLSGQVHLLQKMKELWIFMAPHFTESEPYLKKIKKSKNLNEYKSIVNRLLEEQEFIDG